MRPLHLLAGPSLLLAPAPALAQCPVELVLEQGDDVPGVGLVDTIDNLAVSDFGEVRMWVDTDGSVFTDEAIVDGNLEVLLQEGQPLAAPAGASVLSFDSVTVNDAGASVWNIRLAGTSGSTDDSGLFYGDQLLIQEGSPSTAAGFSTGTVYKDFREVVLNDAGQALVIATVDDPSILGTSNRALVLVEVDGDGDLVSETVVSVEGSLLPGMTSVTSFLEQPGQLALDDAGRALFVATGQPETTLYLDQTPLIQANTPSPIPGRNFSSLSSLSADLNDHGDWAAVTLLTGTQDGNQALLKNGVVVAQKGETHPAIAPFVITSLGAAPVHVDDQGRVVWYAAWDDGSTTNEGWFVDDELVVQEGVTLVDGSPIYSVKGDERSSDLGDDGGFFVFEGRTDPTHNAVFRVRLLPLTGGPGQISLAAGGRQDLELCAGAEHAGDLYLVLGTLSGTSPGLPLAIGTLPLNPDDYFLLSLKNANGDTFVDTFGSLDVQGRASAAFELAPGAGPPVLAGLTAHHAFLALDPVSVAPLLASNAVPLTFAP